MTIRSRGPRFAQQLNPAGQIRQTIGSYDTSRLFGSGGGGSGGSGGSGVSLPVPPQIFSVFDGIPDPTVSMLGMDCAGVTAASDNALQTAITTYFRSRGASDTAINAALSKIIQLPARLRYECSLQSAVGGLGARLQAAQGQIAELQNRAQTAEGQVSTLQGQISSCTGRAQAAENQVADLTARLQAAQTPNGQDSLIASLQSQVTDLTARLQAAVPTEIQAHVQSLESELAAARQKLGGVTPMGVIVGGVVGAVGTYFVTRKKA